MLFIIVLLSLNIYFLKYSEKFETHFQSLKWWISLSEEEKQFYESLEEVPAKNNNQTFYSRMSK